MKIMANNLCRRRYKVQTKIKRGLKNTLNQKILVWVIALVAVLLICKKLGIFGN